MHVVNGYQQQLAAFAQPAGQQQQQPQYLRDEVKFETNQPVDVTFTSLQSRAFEGRRGLRYRYYTEEHAAVFLDEAVHLQLQALQPQPGETFRFIRRSRQPWLIVRLGDAAEPIPVPAPEPAATPAPAPQIVRPAQPPPPPQQQPQPPASNSKYMALAMPMATALKAAVLATREASQFAASEGVVLSFNRDDIRALAITMYIQATKGGAQ